MSLPAPWDVTMFPDLSNLDFYQALPPFQQVSIKSLHYEQLFGFGGMVASVARIFLTIQPFDIQQPPHNLSLIAKVSPIIKNNTPNTTTNNNKADNNKQQQRQQCFDEIQIYNQIITPLSQDFMIRDDLSGELTFDPQYIDPSHNVDNIVTFDCPKIYHSATNQHNTMKLLLMGEILPSATHGLPFFDTWYRGFPSNQKYTDILQEYPYVTPFWYTQKAFGGIAKLHAKYFCNLHNNIPPSQIACYNWYKPYLNRNSDIVDTESEGLNTLSPAKQEYQDFVEFSKQHFNTAFQQRLNQNRISIQPYLLNIMLKAYETSTWDNLQAQYEQQQSLSSACRFPLTICHGDFWVTNTIIAKSRNNSGRVPNQYSSIAPISSLDDLDQLGFFIIDYEDLAISTPCRDLVLYIQRLEPSVREKHERSLLNTYWQNLSFYFELYQTYYRGLSLATNFISTPTTNVKYSSCNTPLDDIYPFDALLKDYRISFFKTMWLIPVLASFNDLPDHILQHSIDQLTSFCKSHDVTLNDVIIYRK